MASFSVILVTAAPAGLASEAGGAFLKIDNRECLLRSVELFLNRDAVKQIHLVVADEKMEEARRKYAAHLGFSGVKLIGASAKWADQLAAAAEKISAECSHVIVHDAARPIVPFNDIDAILHAAEEDLKNPKGPAKPFKTVALATAVRNPLVSVDEGGDPLAFHLPSEFMQIVTPWVYAKEVF
jgi:2-C-methyl-D-erythritol 4-phosphate cytidylyltransferase